MSQSLAEKFRMPNDYDFSNKTLFSHFGIDINWKDYEKDFMLRTDAVYEKQKLLDYFRLYSKCFWFDKTLKKYQFIEPEEAYTLLYEGYALEDLQTYPGMTPTGRTNSFQHGNKKRDRTNTTIYVNAVMQDYYTVCALRFEKWHQCDMVFYDIRDKYDYVLDQSKYKNYPCYRYFYEAQYACTDDQFDFLLELHYAKKADDTFLTERTNQELQWYATSYDAVDKSGQKTRTY